MTLQSVSAVNSIKKNEKGEGNSEKYTPEVILFSVISSTTISSNLNFPAVIMWIRIRQYFYSFHKILYSFLRNFFDPSYAWIPLPLLKSSPPCYASLHITMTPVNLYTRCLQPIKPNLIKRYLNFPHLQCTGNVIFIKIKPILATFPPILLTFSKQITLSEETPHCYTKRNVKSKLKYC